ncbi:hypothetical protein HMPREF3201_00884 [Megasphaera sp. MJR8396C]|nr:hypothetical protein HMPREF3201_00884 [Megasphaera sp. MJR8396C]
MEQGRVVLIIATQSGERLWNLYNDKGIEILEGPLRASYVYVRVSITSKGGVFTFIYLKEKSAP